MYFQRKWSQQKSRVTVQRETVFWEKDQLLRRYVPWFKLAKNIELFLRSLLYSLLLTVLVWLRISPLLPISAMVKKME